MTASDDKPADSKPAAPVFGRRAMIRGAAAAVPTILTLHSGAALARTSNLISKADGAPVDAQGRNLCLDERSAVDKYGKVYDLGKSPTPEVTAIPADRKYYAQANASGGAVSPQQMCEQGGSYWYKSDGGQTALLQDTQTVRASTEEAQGGWTNVRVARGGLVSATALSSFAGRVLVREI